MLASVGSATLFGVEAARPSRGPCVVRPAELHRGRPARHHMPRRRDRVRAALLSSGLKWPMARVTVNLAPPGLRKVGTSLDLPIAVALLAASEQLPLASIADRSFVGELGLDGSVRPVAGPSR